MGSATTVSNKNGGRNLRPNRPPQDGPRVAEKKLAHSVAAKRAIIDVCALSINIRRPCELVGLHRAIFYDAPWTASAFNLQLMRLIDEQYTKMSFYGWLRMTTHVRRLGLPVNYRRIQRLMRTRGLQAISPSYGVHHRPYTRISVQSMPTIDIFRHCQAVLGTSGVLGHITDGSPPHWRLSRSAAQGCA